MRTKVHKNLNRGCWSVTAAGARVVHVECYALAGAALVVQPGGLARVRTSGVRAVHAYAVGVAVPVPAELPTSAREVTYNPFRSEFFHYRDTGERCDGAALLVFHVDGRMYAQERGR